MPVGWNFKAASKAFNKHDIVKAINSGISHELRYRYRRYEYPILRKYNREREKKSRVDKDRRVSNIKDMRDPETEVRLNLY